MSGGAFRQHRTGPSVPIWNELVSDTRYAINTHKYGIIILVKTTIEVPDALFRRAKSAAAQRGIALRTLISEALTDKLGAANAQGKPWMETFGKLKHLHKETVRIDRIIEEEFGKTEPEDLE